MGKRKSKPTSKARNDKQKLRDRYAHAREDAQLAGLIPTTPEEALKPERVDPAAQAEAPMPGLIGEAIRRGWAVPEHRKPDLVDELIKILDDPEVPQKVKVAAFNALRQADQAQFERDYPERAAKARGGTTINNLSNSVTVQTNQAAIAIMNRMLDDPGAGLEDPAAPGEPGTPGDSGQ